MKITNHANLPDAIVRAVVNDPYPQEMVGDLSVTRLIGPPRIRVLERLHRHELEEDASERIWSLLGQIGHGILERAESVAFTEERLFAEVAGWTVSGQFDRMLLLPDGTLQDYKFTSVWAVLDGCKPEWERQLNALRYLATCNGYKIDRLQVVAVLRDWSKGKAKRGGDYPPRQVALVDAPVWPMAESERYMLERVRLHQAAERGTVPACTSEERWAKPTTYAVRKPGRKSALRLFEDRSAADRLAAETPGGYVEVRPGESVRCADYCTVAPFCEQRRVELAEKDRAA